MVGFGDSVMSDSRTEEERTVRVIRARNDFVKWLESQPRTKRFGGMAKDCALAEFCGGPVGWTTYMNGSLPKWAVEFIQGFVRGKRQRTVANALLVMRELP